MKRIIPILLALLLILTGCTAPSASQSAPSYRRISADEAAAQMDALDSFILLDVRTQAEYDETHIPGAICIPNETIGSDAPAALPDKNQPIFVYCRSGNRSKQAAQKLADLGYTQVFEFGGIRDWHGETTP